MDIICSVCGKIKEEEEFFSYRPDLEVCDECLENGSILTYDKREYDCLDESLFDFIDDEEEE